MTIKRKKFGIHNNVTKETSVSFPCFIVSKLAEDTLHLILLHISLKYQHDATLHHPIHLQLDYIYGLN